MPKQRNPRPSRIPAQRKPLGRPSAYRSEYPDTAFKLCLLGATDKEMAGIFGVSEQTLNAWKATHPDFLASITRGKVEADANVADRMYKRALGYSHEAVKIFMPAGAAEPVYAPYTEHYPPDTQAASLWLRNRRPESWRDKREVVSESTVTVRDERAQAVEQTLTDLFGASESAAEGNYPRDKAESF